MSRAGLKVVVFDLGGVLLPFDRERRVAAIAGRYGVAPEAVRALESRLAGPLDLGEADERHLVRGLSELAGEPVETEQALDLWLRVFEAPNLELWELAGRLRRRLRVAGFSDNPRFVRRVLADEDLLDPLFLSCELKAVKPSPESFQAVQAGLGVEPGEILFVDDGEANIAAAERAGWDGVRFTSNAALREDLAARGLAWAW